MAERDPRYRADLRERAKQLYLAGHSTSEVAGLMELSRTRISQLLNDAGVKLRPRGWPAGKPRGRRNARRHQRHSPGRTAA